MKEELDYKRFPDTNPNPVLAVKIKNHNKIEMIYVNKSYEMLKSSNEDLENLLKIEFLKKLEKGEEPIRIETEVVLNNEKKYFRWLFYIDPDNPKLHYVYSSDITLLKKVIDECERGFLFPENNPNPVISFNNYGEIEYANPATYKYVNLDAKNDKDKISTNLLIQKGFLRNDHYLLVKRCIRNRNNISDGYVLYETEKGSDIKLSQAYVFVRDNFIHLYGYEEAESE